MRFNITLDYSRDALLDDFSKTTFRDRYLLPGEDSPQEAFARTADAYASDEAHAQRLYDYASKKWLSFATPVIANAGSDRGLPISCFLNYVPDSREGILSSYTENGWLASMGGGIGSYYGDLRSSGEATSKGSRSSGVVPFMKVVDSQMMAFSQGGTRRGSAAMYLDISHPEIEEFIVMRKMTGGDTNRKTPNLHNGVNITDDFMRAVLNGDPWNLVDPHSNRITKTIPARDLWVSMLTTRLETGEPYLFFIDTANRALPQALKDKGLRIRHSNLCSEITLPTNEERTAVCCLSSLNVEFYSEWSIIPEFISDIMEMLDNVLQYFIDTAPKELARAVYSATQERSVGLGMLGWHYYLQRNNIAFESESAEAHALMIARHIEKGASAASKALAITRGEAPDMEGTGERFSHKTATAPNASTSTLLGTSPSGEPVKANAYLHKTLSGSIPVKNKYLIKVLEEYEKNDNETWQSIITNNGSVQHLDFLSESHRRTYKTASELDQLAIIRLAAIRQKYIDQSQSINVFLPADVSARELHEVHFSAWQMGLKSLYYLRSETARRAESVSTTVVRVKIEDDEDDCRNCEG